MSAAFSDPRVLRALAGSPPNTVQLERAAGFIELAEVEIKDGNNERAATLCARALLALETLEAETDEQNWNAAVVATPAIAAGIEPDPTRALRIGCSLISITGVWLEFALVCEKLGSKQAARDALARVARHADMIETLASLAMKQAREINARLQGSRL